MKSTSEKKNRKSCTSNNPKTANPITMDTDTNMHKPVRGLPNK